MQIDQYVKTTVGSRDAVNNTDTDRHTHTHTHTPMRLLEMLTMRLEQACDRAESRHQVKDGLGLLVESIAGKKHMRLWACLARRCWLGPALGRSRTEQHSRVLAWAGTLWNNVCLECHSTSTSFIIASALLLIFFITGRPVFFTACSSLLFFCLDPLQKMQDNSVRR